MIAEAFEKLRNELVKAAGPQIVPIPDDGLGRCVITLPDGSYNIHRPEYAPPNVEVESLADLIAYIHRDISNRPQPEIRYSSLSATYLPYPSEAPDEQYTFDADWSREGAMIGRLHDKSGHEDGYGQRYSVDQAVELFRYGFRDALAPDVRDKLLDRLGKMSVYREQHTSAQRNKDSMVGGLQKKQGVKDEAGLPFTITLSIRPWGTRDPLLDARFQVPMLIDVDLDEGKWLLHVSDDAHQGLCWAAQEHIGKQLKAMKFDCQVLAGFDAKYT